MNILSGNEELTHILQSSEQLGRLPWEGGTSTRRISFALRNLQRDRSSLLYTVLRNYAFCCPYLCEAAQLFPITAYLRGVGLLNWLLDKCLSLSGYSKPIVLL